MKYPILFLLPFFIITSCNPKNDNAEKIIIENQIEQLSETEIDEFKTKLIRHIGKLPTEVSHQTKFSSFFDEHYEKEKNKYDLEKYFNHNDKIYFLFTRIAPSIKLKRVALGGYVSFDEEGNISDLEEVFRTWKKEPQDLQSVADMLFEKMIYGEDLSPYYPENSGEEEVIEFPNAEVYYDKNKKIWVTTRENPLEQYHEAKAKRIEEVLEKKDNTNK
jgi:hypothetical protein